MLASPAHSAFVQCSSSEGGDSSGGVRPVKQRTNNMLSKSKMCLQHMHVLTSLLVAAAQVSGVIAVVVYGLYGSATAKWGLSPKVAESGVFDEFWDTIGFGITGMVFFFSGVSSVNFFVRSAQVGWLSLSLGISPGLTLCLCG